MAERSGSPRPTQRRYPPELRERAVRMVREVATEQGERHGAITRVAKSLGIGPESVRLWVRQAEIDEGDRTGLTTAERERMKQLERDNRELRRANEMNRHRWEQWLARPANSLPATAVRRAGVYLSEHAGPLPRFLDESEKGGVKGFPSDLVETAATAVLNPKPETCGAALRVPCGPGWQASLQKSDSSFATDRRLGRSDAIRERQRQGDRQGWLR